MSLYPFPTYNRNASYLQRQSGYPSISGIPTGIILPFAGSILPNGWLICDGRSLSKTQYFSLYNTIGDVYGSTATEFNIPDLRGRVILGVGQGDGLTSRTLGQTGGSETQTLTVNQLPAHNHIGTTDSDGLHIHAITDLGHTHTGTTDSDGLHTHTSNAVGGQNNLGLVTANSLNTVQETDSSSGELNVWTTPFALSINQNGAHTHTFTTQNSTTGVTVQNNGLHTHTFTTQNTGNNEAHNNMQPFISINYMIRYI
jgi:microcystin-dependent protein